MAKVELKKPVVDEISELLNGAKSAVLVDYRGLTVEEDTILCQLGRPQAETVVMFGGNNRHLESRLLQGTHPLLAVQLRGLEEGRFLLAAPPLVSGKGVDAEMQETGELHLLPLQLLRSGHQPRRHLQFLFHGCPGRESYMFLIILFRLGSPSHTEQSCD